ncbi:hypothetical protein [Amycolatopsis methanolica]|uniref:hypothetical protein n=1 Tax=Amycolatopsis methanolica TaxID=1814 RepID=UPI0012E0C1A5|nr:hypothetical protein [Amycolatopsis methanolica]
MRSEVGQRRDDLVAEVPVGKAGRGRGQGQVGLPHRRAEQVPEVLEGGLANQFGRGGTAAVRSGERVQPSQEDPPDQDACRLPARRAERRLAAGEFEEEVAEEGLPVRPLPVHRAAGDAGLADQLREREVVQADRQAGAAHGLGRGGQHASLRLLVGQAWPAPPAEGGCRFGLH